MTTILIIEDDPNIRESINDMLEIEGFTVVETDNGEQGVKLAVEHNPELVICDIMLPGMDGYDVLKAIHSIPETRLTPFVFLTARTDRKDLRKGMHMGADDYLTKPFTNEELLDTLKVQLAKRAEIASTMGADLETAKKTLIHLVAHELRTPLVSLKMVEEIINLRMGQLTDDDVGSFMEVVTKSTRRMGHLVEQMVLTTEIQANILTADIVQEYAVPTGIWELMTSVVELGRKFATRNNDTDIHVSMRDRDTTVNCTVQSLKHALAEIVTNAINFSKGETVMVYQWTTETSCCISVTDSGPGMPAGTIEKAMRPFEQINRERQEQQGFGMGLTLANAIIEMHGGQMEIQSVLDKGTQVTVCLPRA
ncbi:MAG: hybrid sensor histidine kinase/response regulator [Chloroflexi bacterium]|nr:hybrid sensor histidine kinase/response regulator [Chloroflexota bacterium]